MTRHVDVAVVGAGLIGLATVYEILRQRPDLRVAVSEKEDQIAAHQSRRNSGVIHAGVYYRPGSLKATLCLEGRAALEQFTAHHGIPTQHCGKLIIAVQESEFPALEQLSQRATANGVPGVRECGAGEIPSIEPHAAGLRALHIPSTAIVDFGQVADAYAQEARSRGAEILLEHGVESTVETSAANILLTQHGETRATCAVFTAGLYADRLLGTARRTQQIVPFRGTYYKLRPERTHLVKGLIYPVPNPSLPFLGTHLTKRIDGEVWAGPNAVLALAREGYRRRDVNFRELGETVTFPGFRRLARRYWKVAAEELWLDMAKSASAKQLRRYVPELSANDLVPGPSGVRAQLVGRDGTLVDDFTIVQTPTAIHVLNAPSPAATASLAIGRRIAALALDRLTDRGVA